MENYEKELEQKFNEFEKNIENHKPTIILLGQTGCGKSTLGNMILGNEEFETSDIISQTKEFEYKSSKLMNIVDSRGYELSDNNEKYLEEIINGIQKLENDDKINVTTIWYCISVAGKRIQPIDLLLIEQIKNKLKLNKKLKIVYTKSDEDTSDEIVIKSFDKIIKEKFGNIKTYRVTNDKKLKEELDFEELIEDTANDIDNEDVRRSFIIAQKGNLKLKKQEAQKIVNIHGVAAALIGASPIPFSDAALLVPEQMMMIYQISRIFGLEKSLNTKGNIGTVLSTTLGKKLATSIAGNVIKLVPAVGSFIGGAINTAVAGGMTLALGHGITEYSYNTAQKILNGEKVDLEDLFSSDVLKNIFTKENIEKGISNFSKIKK